jgi:acyl-CoA synthetase (AMP-forming)/AMP-acid ligase II
MALTIASIQEAVAAVVPERDAIVMGETRLDYAGLTDRTRRLANFLVANDITVHTERADLANWEVGQDRVGLLMHNCPTYLEAMIGAFKARAIPFNVNYRYVGEELLYLFNDARPTALVYQARFAEILAPVLAAVPSLRMLIQVADDSATPLLPGAVDYEATLATSSGAPVPTEPSPDDIYCTYTGGTTGMPKGVLWRQEDSIWENLNGRSLTGDALANVDAFAERAATQKHRRNLAAPPFMHGAGCQTALAALLAGNTVLIQDQVARLDVGDLLRTVERQRADMLLIIGDAYGRPLLKEIPDGGHDLSSLRLLYNTGAILSPANKAALLSALPRVKLLDAFGSSESGPQGFRLSDKDGEVAGARFRTSPATVVLGEDLRTALAPGHDGLGWVAKRGAVPYGYLGDEKKTRETFPEIDGVRHLVGGDRVRLLANGEIEFHGRESFTINSGGEKIFAEEVEDAIKHHPDVADVTVTSRPSPRWGQEVVALVQLTPGATPDALALATEAHRHIARYKLPKAWLFVDTVQRGPSGKTDNRWAQSLAKDAE